MHPFHAFHRRFHRQDGPPDDDRGRRGRGPADGHRDHRGGRGFQQRDGGDGGDAQRGGRSELGRFFAHGDLRLVILHLVAEKPRHGYEIIKAIEDSVRGAYSPSPGVVYPTLTLLEELGHAFVTPGEGTKKLYAITPEGQAMLDASRPTVDALLRRMAEAARAFGDGPPPSVKRAAEGLKMALRLRLARGPFDDDASAAIAAALDAAAAAVARA